MAHRTSHGNGPAARLPVTTAARTGWHGTELAHLSTSLRQARLRETITVPLWDGRPLRHEHG
jgi:hypothetical protein